MSYRSDIKICMRDENWRELRRVFDKAVESGELDAAGASILDIFEPVVVNDENGTSVYSIESIKWYLSYKEVTLIDNYIRGLVAAEVPCKFIRIGEDINDIEIIEYYGSGECDRLGVYTGIEVY